MRWDKLFDDLESQLEQELSAEELDLEAEEERLRLGRLAVRDRLVALHGLRQQYSVVVILASGIRLAVHPVAFGRDWFSADLLADDGAPTRARAQCILPLAAIAGVGLAPEQVAASLVPDARSQDNAPLSSRLGLPFVLRDLCRRRRPLDVVLAHGELHGTLDRVGRDHFDLAVHDRGVARRESAVREYRLIPLAAVQLLRL